MNNTYSKTLSYKDYFSKTMATMAIGLGISGFTAWLFARLNILYLIYSFGALSTVIVLGLAVGELAISIYFSTRLMQMSRESAWICYVAYSVLTGLSLSSVLSFYSNASVTVAFLTTAVLFVCMAIIGRTTSVDLTKVSSLIFVGVSTICIISILNSLIFHFYTVNLFIAYLGIILFLFMIAYDAQVLDRYYNYAFDNETQEKLMIMAAFQLYLDFINLFTRLLQLYGRRSNEKRR